MVVPVVNVGLSGGGEVGDGGQRVTPLRNATDAINDRVDGGRLQLSLDVPQRLAALRRLHRATPPADRLTAAPDDDRNAAIATAATAGKHVLISATPSPRKAHDDRLPRDTRHHRPH